MAFVIDIVFVAVGFRPVVVVLFPAADKINQMPAAAQDAVQIAPLAFG